MRTLHENIWNAFKKIKNESDWKIAFRDWKYELRHHDITCDVVNKLDGVPQYTHWHPEFDALLHTWLVCRAVMKLEKDRKGFNIYGPDLLESAFLHDYGKGDRTNIGADKIYHFGHPQESVRFIDTIKNYLQNYDLCRRISLKHMDYPIGHKALKLDPMLAEFIQADKVVSKQIYDKEASAWDKIANKTKERFVFMKQRSSNKRVTVMVGIPGSGKSTFLKPIDKKLIVSPDNIRREINGDVSNMANGREVWEITKQRMLASLAQYNKVYLDATNVIKFQRVEFMSAFNHAHKTAMVFEVDVEEAIRRVKTDIENGEDRSNVPEKVIRKFHKLFERGKKSLPHEFNDVFYYKGNK